MFSQVPRRSAGYFFVKNILQIQNFTYISSLKLFECWSNPAYHGLVTDTQISL